MLWSEDGEGKNWQCVKPNHQLYFLLHISFRHLFRAVSFPLIPLISSHPSYYLSSIVSTAIPLILSCPSHYLPSLSLSLVPLYSLITLVSFIPLTLFPSHAFLSFYYTHSSHSIIHLVLFTSIILVFSTLVSPIYIIINFSPPSFSFASTLSLI